MDSSKRPSEANEAFREISEAPRRDSGLTFWQYVGAVLAGVLAASVIASGLGRAFFVDRPTYEAEIRTNAVEHARIGSALGQFERAMNVQAEAFEKLQAAVQAQAVEMGKLGRHR